MKVSADLKTPGLYCAYGHVYGRFVISESFCQDEAEAGWKTMEKEIENNLPPMLREQAR